MTASEQRVYSQGAEQNAILESVKQLPAGKFLDIGAWSATDKSNTRALFERGWSGLMIEPSPGPFLNLLRACSSCGDVPLEQHGERKAPRCAKCGGQRYGNDDRLMLICAAVGLDSRLLKMHVTDDAVSTADEQVFSTWQRTGGYYGSFYTPQITMDEIFNQFGGDFGFVSIDAEGMSGKLFLRMLELGPRPQCVCVEHDGQEVSLIYEASRAGYRLAMPPNAENLVLTL